MHVEDLEGNFLDTPRRSIPVEVDMTPPTFGVDHSPDPGTTGDEYKFSVGVKDDYQLDLVQVTYSFGEGTSVTETMEGRRNFRFTITVPVDCQVDLSYQFYAVDASGNSNKTLWKRVNIIDNDEPVAEACEAVEVIVGEELELDGSGSVDNIGIKSYSWSILAYGEETTSSGANPTFKFTDPGDYNVTLMVEDEAGNTGTDYHWLRAIGPDEPPAEPPVTRSTQPLPLPGILAFIVLIVLLIVTLFILKDRYDR
jgi:hypothetical protein